MAEKDTDIQLSRPAGERDGRERALVRERRPAWFSPLAEFERDMESLLPRSMLPWRGMSRLMPAFSEALRPVDVIERDDTLIVRAEVPGIESQDLDVDVTREVVTIRGQHREEARESQENYLRSEISHSEIHRRIELPVPVDPDRASARCEHGVLEITLPKVEAARPRRLNLGQADSPPPSGEGAAGERAGG
ncbi:MAG TPA: Hsp20/alpha crystallin family protein [Gammaproteobacteria bacterium]|nr:Hsp20/alpha crystallin family protein [Gammaproteobacteria bacterium]